MVKKVLIASFIFPERLDWFLNYLSGKFKINPDNVFVFRNLDDESRLIVTFMFKIKNNKKVNLKKLFPDPILIHKRGDCLYTINSLNKIIESEVGGDIGNIDYSSIEIDWSKYQGKLLLTNNNKLSISNIQRIK